MSVTDDGELGSALEEMARGAGAILMSHLGKLETVGFKGKRDLVTRADEESEAYVLGEIRRRFPDHAILSEEAGEDDDFARGLESGTVWIVDPLDGTTNFVHRLPMFAVSLGVYRDGEPLAGCIFAPRLDEMFLAVRGRGVTLDGRPIRVSDTEDLIDAVLATGFAYRVDELEQNNLDHFARLVPRTRAVRRCGSAALDLAYTACGRFDGFWELHLGAWDVAAGAALILEAGGVVTDFAGGSDWLLGGNVVAGNEAVHAHLMADLGGRP